MLTGKTLRYSIARNHTAVAGGIATGVQLFVAREAMAKPLGTRIAHSAHYESEPVEQVNPSETSAVFSDKSLGENIESDATVKEIPANPVSVSASEARLLDGFSIGLGETLLAFVIAGPFLLISMKQRPRS